MLKLVIPSAGLGTRIGPYSKFKNKGLLSIGCLPAISRVIQAFSSIDEIVIILGYQGAALRDAVESLHPDKKITFVTVDKFSGPGAGLGYSLNSAKQYLQCPFVFSPNDAILSSFPQHDFISPYSGNIIGYYCKQHADSYRLEDFRTIEIDDGIVGKIFPKGSGTSLIYTGIARVQEYRKFWDAMDSDLAIDAGEVIGLAALPTLRGVELKDWQDCGTVENLEQARSRYKSPDFTILEKANEAIWFKDDRVIKFSSDPDFIYGRLQRHTRLPLSLRPDIIYSTKHTYVYTKVQGHTLDTQLHPGRIVDILNAMQQHVWSHSDTETDKSTLHQLASNFYKNKTIDRCLQYQKRYEDSDYPILINGVLVPSLRDQLSTLDWDTIAAGCLWANFHGDFHPDNIIVSQSNFCLIDWRQDFGRGFYTSGDVYYDLAKFMHGLEINHKIISEDGFSIHWKNSSDVRIDVLQRMSLLDAKVDFLHWLQINNYSVKRVNLLTALVYLNIACLHEYPYAQFLYFLGRFRLNQCLTAP